MDNQKGKKRNAKIDNLRAIAIVLVVIGHSIILYSSGWNLYTTNVQVPFLDKVKDWINVVQMPLFFMLSGYLFSPKQQMGQLIINKTKRLLVPYFCVAALWMIPIKMLLNYPPYGERNYFQIFWQDIVLYQDTGHLWFLPCLFFCFVVSGFLFRIMSFVFPQHERTVHMFLFVMLLFASFESVRFSYALPRYLTQYLVWFYLGICMRCFQDILAKLGQHYGVCVLFLFAAMLLSVIELGKFQTMFTFVLLFLGYLAIPNRTNGMTDFLSKNSFGIYLLHSPLIYITFTYWKDESPILVVAMNFLIFGGLAGIGSVLIASSPMKFMLGIFAKKE